MKILYIGNYRDGTGWANACINNILALDSVGVDIVPRPITFEQQQQNYPDKIKQLEMRSTEGCDICIQHTLPHLYSYDGRYKKNIGYLAVESSNFKQTGWQNFCNLMDEIWVPSSAAKKSCENSGVKKPIKVAPHSLNISSYSQPEARAQIEELIPTFNFIFVGEFVERKNLEALIKAFHIEFEHEEPVNLVIKTSRTSLEDIKQHIRHTKARLKIKQKYKHEISVVGMMEKKDYISLLAQCHCFVMPSRGEAFCIPALEAMAIGMPVISTKHTGMDDFCIGESVDSFAAPCFGAMSTLSYLDTAQSDWREIDVRKLCLAMRKAYLKWNSKEELEIRKTAQQKALEYDHETMGQYLKGLLNDS
jgi:glycosyltransferase involved in cell wall biosynthesis|tara:strand:+ start:585 stop:1673 length:1089 start_codon:yes stop_codon:yes gene_type:complete